MARLTPDPSFYPSPKLATEAPPERLAYVTMLNPTFEGAHDAIGVVDVDPDSDGYGELVGRCDMPEVGDELHHFGWNACSSCLCPTASHPHMERRYLVVPGLRSSRIMILDTKPDPHSPKVVKTISAAELAEKTGYSRPHTSHCGPDGIYMSALGAPDGGGPGGIFVMDPETFELKGAWEEDHGPQVLSYDFWWHLGYDTLITSEWGTPNMVEGGVNPELLLGGKYGHHIHLWDLPKRRHLKAIDLGEKQQMVLELRPAHDPKKAYGFVGVVTSLEDLSASVWLWRREGSNGGSGWTAEKVITIPAEPAEAEDLPELLKGFGAVPPLVTDINLTVDDTTLYVSCWGTGELKQYDVSDPANPVETGSLRIGGIVGQETHPSRPGARLNGGPQMVEVSRDGRRIYFTNSLYASWDAQFYPDGIEGWMVKVDAEPSGGMAFDEGFFLSFDGHRPHQVHLEGGDASSDSYCFS
jgi:selenium-binding protein 1